MTQVDQFLKTLTLQFFLYDQKEIYTSFNLLAIQMYFLYPISKNMILQNYSKNKNPVV
jgi:hypothetical protein